MLNENPTFIRIRNVILILCGLVTLGCIIALIVIKFNPELNDTIGDIERRFEEAETVDEQLRQLNRIAKKYGNQISASLLADFDKATSIGGIKRLAEPLPEDLMPDIESAQEASTLPESLRDAKFLALYQKWSSSSDLYLMGDFQIRLPKAMRATTLEDVDAVLLLFYDEETRTDYISTGPGGGAVNRCYNIYVCERGGPCWLVYSKTVTPPVSGTGVLRGTEVSQEALWESVKQMFRK